MADSFSLGAFVAALRKRLQPKTAEEGAKEGAEEVSKALPSVVMPREAILRKRRQMEEIDKATRE